MNNSDKYRNYLFEMMKPMNNNSFQKLKGNDLLKLIVFLNDYYLELRSNLGLNSDITFGLELEYEDAFCGDSFVAIRDIKKMISNKEWIVKHDGSLHTGVEINSPILRDCTSNWIFLDKVCEQVKRMAIVGKKSGGHIHIGTQILGNHKEAWINFIKLWSIYENVIFRFAYGEFLTARNSLMEYAMPTMNLLYQIYEKIKKDDIKKIIDILKETSRYQAVNFWNIDFDNLDKCLEGNTIEFRCPNSSLNAVIWQNDVNFLTKMLLYCKSTRFNNDILDNRLEINHFLYDNLNLYDEIFLDQALELCDMVFTNNLDKIYFLKQYLKALDINQEFGEFTRSKEFVKK